MVKVSNFVNNIFSMVMMCCRYHELSDKEILDHLLHRQRYDKRIKPPMSGTLRVNVSVVLLSLSSPDESSLHYEVEFLMHQKWSDPRLVHDDGER